jgi:hypothetical protein
MIASRATNDITSAVEVGDVGSNVPIRVVDSEGNILDITEIKWSGLNGGAVHIYAEAPDE